jgi:hypothetical protein
MNIIKNNFQFLVFCFLISAFCYAQPPDSKREKMIIVSYFSFVPQLSQYVEAKTNDNIDCIVISIDSTDNFNTIKSKIDELYNGFPADFLLLVGDNEHIPAYKIEEGLSDIHYAFENENNPVPRMSVGRFSVETAQDLQTMIDRSLIRKPFSKHAVGIASNKISELTQKKDYEQVRFMGQQLQAKGFSTVSELFDGSPNGNPKYSDVIAALQSGASWINYVGKGSYEGWNTSGFENHHIDSLPDNVELPIILSASCLGGHFANRTCFAEKWLRSTQNGNPTGAIAVIMSSSLTDWDATPSAMLAITKNMPATNSNCRLGNLYLQGYRYILDSMQRPKDAQCWVLFGDPSLWIYPPAETNISEKNALTPSPIIYPNPTSNQLRITNYELRMGNIEIYDVVGRLQQSKIVNLQSEIIIDISHLPAGMYFLYIDRKTIKIIKD